jgi:hypothetical protein
MQPAQTAPCLFPLRTEGAQQEYRSIAEALARAGVMYVHNHRLLSSYVAQLDNIIVAQQQKRQIRGSWFTQMDRARNKLKLHALEKHLQPVVEPPRTNSRSLVLRTARECVLRTPRRERCGGIGVSG